LDQVEKLKNKKEDSPEKKLVEHLKRLVDVQQKNWGAYEKYSVERTIHNASLQAFSLCLDLAKFYFKLDKEEEKK